jgi:hypothetical protein
MKTIILGFPRSGTKTMAVLKEVGHECWNINGTSDWHLVPSYFKRPDDYLIHVVRNPLDVISSNFYTAQFGSIKFMADTLKLEDKSRIVEILIRGWIEWNKRIESYSPDEIVNIENVNKVENSRKHPTLDLTQFNLNKQLLEEFVELALKYGYEI